MARSKLRWVAPFTVLLLPLLMCPTQAADKQPPKVDHIFFQQTAPGQVTILYDLSGEAGKKYTVWAYFSTDSGKTFSVIPTTTSGDVGKGVTPGILREIVWDMGKDYPAGLPDFNPAHYVCLITVKKQKKLWRYIWPQVEGQ